jgi:hypothetical protein
MWVWGTTTNAYRILVEKPLGKRQLERPKRRWEYNRWILENGCETGWQIALAQDHIQWQALIFNVLNLRIP